MVSQSDCMEWLKKRSPLEKTLLSMSSLLLLTLLLLVLIGITFKGQTSCNSSPDSKEGCWTKDCIKLAGDVLDSMVTQADSCTDFYTVGCGSYKSSPSHAPSAAKEAVDSVYQAMKNLLESSEASSVDGFEDLKSFYNSCIQFGDYRPKAGTTSSTLQELMHNLGIGVWPILDPLYDTSTFSLEHTLVSLVLLDVPVVFRMEVVPDQQTDGSYLIKISPGGPRETGRTPSEIRGDIHLRSSVLSSLLLLGVSAANTNNEVNDILSVDSSFAAIEQDETTACDLNILSPDEAVLELNRIIPEINWAYVLAEVRRATGLVRTNFGVHLFCKHKIRDYVVHLNDLSIRSETNYLGWRFFSKFVNHILPTFEMSRYGEKQQSSRWRLCLDLMQKLASPLLSRALAAKMIEKETYKEVDKIANATLIATHTLINEAKWLNDQQKSRIRKKASLLRFRSPLQSNEDLESSADVPQVDVSNFTSAVIHLERKWVIQRFKRLALDDQPAVAWTPLITPAEDTVTDDFAVPIYFDVLQSPFLRKHASQWMNFGGLGMSVARQISQIILSFHVDPSDSGGLSVWNVWKSANPSSTCFLDSVKARYGLKMQSLSESVVEGLLRHLFVERSAIEIAYKAAQSSAEPSGSLPGLDWSDQKMFFLSLTQSLCTTEKTSEGEPEFATVQNRLNSVLASYQPFTETFGCSPSSTQCHIWG